MKIYSIGIRTTPKEFQQNHQPHPKYVLTDVFRCYGIGIYATNKDNAQSHQPHPKYAYPNSLTIDVLGIYNLHAADGRPERSYIIKSQKRM